MGPIRPLLTKIEIIGHKCWLFCFCC